MAGSSSGGKSDAGRDVHVTKRKQAEVNESDIRPSQCQEHLGDAAAKSPDKDILLATSDVSKKGKVSTTPTAAKVPVSSQEEDDLAVVVAKCWNDFLSAEFSLGKTYSGLPLSLNYGKYQELLSGQGNFVSKVNKALFVMFPEDYKNKCAKDLLIPISNAEDYPMLNCDPSLATNTTILDLPAELVGEDEEYTEGDATVLYYQGIQENAESFDKHHVDFDIQILGEELDWIYWTGNKELKAVGGKKGVEGLGKILHRIKAIEKSGKGAAIDFFKDKKAKNTSKKVRLAEDLHHFWKPKENKRKRVNNIGLSAEKKQRIKNEELNTICDREQPNQHMESFEERLMQSELLLQAKKPNENNSKIISRVNKATQDYQKELNKQYRNVDQGTLEFVSKYKIKAPKQNQYSHDEIRKIRYEPITTNKAKSSFTIYCGPQETAIAKITVAYVAYYLGSGFVAKCLAFGKRCADSNLNQPSFIVPLGDSNFDTAPDSCLCKLDKNGARVKILRFVQGASNCCLGFSLANALHHLNFHEEAYSLYRWSHELSEHNATVQFKKLSRWVQTSVKGVTCLSLLESRKFDRLDGLLQCISLLREQDLVVFVPQANDGTKTHAVTFCCGLIFDSTQQYPLRLSEESLKFIALFAGFAGIWRARLFSFGK